MVGRNEEFPGQRIFDGRVDRPMLFQEALSAETIYNIYIKEMADHSARRLLTGLARAVCQQRKPMVIKAMASVRIREKANTGQPISMR